MTRIYPDTEKILYFEGKRTVPYFRLCGRTKQTETLQGTKPEGRKFIRFQNTKEYSFYRKRTGKILQLFQPTKMGGM